MKPSIVKGWHYPKEVYLDAHENNRLAKLLIELSNVCNLSCSGCFTKRVERSWSEKGKSRLPNEMSYEDQLHLLDEAAALGVKAVDIVGAGEPTLDRNFRPIIDEINNRGGHAVVFTHGVSEKLECLEDWKAKGISFFFKLWSMNLELQNRYVQGSIEGYAFWRNVWLSGYVNNGFSEGEDIEIDSIPYRTTRLGADILVMKSNFSEIPDLFRYCRRQGIMPEIKTYIPEGPTRFDSKAKKLYDEKLLEELKKDEIPIEEFWRLREDLQRIDREEFGIDPMGVLYPGGSKCTQSMGSFYVTIEGDMRSCVGSHVSYGKYEPGNDMLRKAVEKRKEAELVGFGCVPRLLDAASRGLLLGNMKAVYGDGMR